MPPAVSSLYSSQPMEPGNWAEPRAVTWGLRILDNGRLGLYVPYEPGDDSSVAKMFVHKPHRYLRS